MPRSGIGLNELLGATLLAGAAGCKQCKHLTEAALPVRALIAPSVVHATKTRLAMNLVQACQVTKPLPSVAELPGMTQCAPCEPSEEQRDRQLSEGQGQAKHAPTILAIKPLHIAVRDG